MPTTEAPTRTSLAPWAGLVAAVLLVLAAIVVPWVTGWEVHARSERATATSGSLPPLHGFWDPRLGAGTAAAVLIALLGWRYAVDLADRLPWRRLLLLSYVVGLGWMLALALVDGPVGISRVLAHGYEYLATARTVDDVPALLDGFVQRIDGSNPDHWVTHVAGHPPGALLFFVALVRVGLGGDLAAGLAVIAVAATTAPAVLATVRTLGAEAAARRAAPFLVLGPAAVFMAVSADAVFGAVAAWGLAALAMAATRGAGRAWIGWSLVAGLLLGCCVLLSYGLVLLGPLALAVLVVARSWRPLPVAAGAALCVVLAVRGVRLRLVGGLRRGPRALLGRHRGRPAGGVLAVGRPGRTPRLGRARAGRGAGRARRCLATDGPGGRAPGRGGRCGRARGRPVPDEQGRGGADLAAVRAVAAAVDGAVAGVVAPLGAGAAGGHGAARGGAAVHDVVAAPFQRASPRPVAPAPRGAATSGRVRAG